MPGRAEAVRSQYRVKAEGDASRDHFRFRRTSPNGCQQPNSQNTAFRLRTRSGAPASVENDFLPRQFST
jgi:hypothetical protein